TFELVGRDSNGAPVVKYGFTLKQWFVHRGFKLDTPSNILSWCNSIGYRMSGVRDLTNAVRTDVVVPSATPSSPGNYYMRHIGAGFVPEWGSMDHYSDIDFKNLDLVWTNDLNGSGYFVVSVRGGGVSSNSNSTITNHGLCSHP
ncbi:hypothetical protein J3U16_11970, partial [Gilliamella sp. B3023]|uniref:hypothetical protein n=1 Tax=Gilliamella sp. B3023 TaxID=2817987 RepID=UPI00226AE9F0